jgi:peptidoglycan/LPS O-acetylase OafA/YrhL
MQAPGIFKLMEIPEQKLSGNLSVYIDLLRVAAALAVFLDHAGNLIFPHIKDRFIFQQSNNAVALFFVLSGFVINYSTSGKQRNVRSYFVARSSRIYSVALLALAVTIIADVIGMSHDPAIYLNAKFYRPESIIDAIRCLTFTNEIWFSHAIFGSNEPYWSLGFEVSYYIFFALICFSSGRLRLMAILLWFLVFGPKIALYLPLWLLGVFACKFGLRHRPPLARAMALAGFTASIAGYLFLSASLSPVAVPMFYMFNLPSLELASFLNFLLVGVLACINILCFDALTGDRKFWPRGLEHGIKWLAGATFTLYLVHQPLLTMMAALRPDGSRHVLLGCFYCLVVLVIALALAELGERRKRAFARIIWMMTNYSTKITGRTKARPF